jgi:hypothetical protein
VCVLDCVVQQPVPAGRKEREKKKVERCYKRQRGLALGLNAFITRFVGSQCCREQTHTHTHTHTISHCLRPLYCRCVYACERVGGPPPPPLYGTNSRDQKEFSLKGG